MVILRKKMNKLKNNREDLFDKYNTKELKITEHKFHKSTLMGGWYIPKNICKDINKLIDNNYNNMIEGITRRNGKVIVDKSFKESKELPVPLNENRGPFTKYKEFLKRVIIKYSKKFPEMLDNSSFGLAEDYNLQRYPIFGGFKKWHFENDFRSNLNYHRCLVFMTYLNDVEDGGTEFKYQNLICPAKEGLTLIWPAYWTHTHRGIPSKTKEKSIVTGWISYLDYVKENKRN